MENILKNSQEEKELMENISKSGIGYIAKNFKLLDIFMTEQNKNEFHFEGGLILENSGWSASSEDVLQVQLLNSNRNILATW